MELRTVRHQIANLRRHYGLHGSDILACYDTALVALFGLHTVKYVTVSVSPTNWKALSEKVDLDAQVKHPGSGVPCLKLFDNLYVRAESRVGDTDVLWSANTGCYSPTSKYLCDSLQKVVMASKSTKRQIEHANNVLADLSKKMERV